MKDGNYNEWLTYVCVYISQYYTDICENVKKIINENKRPHFLFPFPSSSVQSISKQSSSQDSWAPHLWFLSAQSLAKSLPVTEVTPLPPVLQNRASQSPHSPPCHSATDLTSLTCRPHPVPSASRALLETHLPSGF